ncbi:MAG: hypothetical protein AABX04_01995 [Nanoarchaeota archaeon]
MPLCGFNQKMLDGLRAFNEGLVEHGLIERSERKQQTIDDTLGAELADMKRFLRETPALSDPKVKKLVEGLTIYAQGVYEVMQGQNVSKYGEVVRTLNGLFEGMDSKYYSELEGKTDDMKQLVQYLNIQRV